MDEFGGSLLEGLDDAVLVTDERLSVVAWNGAMEQLSGVARDAARGRSALDALGFLRDPETAAHLARAAAGEVSVTGALRYASAASGREGWLEGRYLPWYDARGRVAGVIGVYVEASERRRTATFVRAMAAIGQSLTSSLDLNEVLDTIVGKAVEVMTSESALVVSWDGQAPAFTIMRAAGRLSAQYAETGKIPVGGGPISRAMLQARTVTTPNILTDPETWLDPARRAQIEREGYKAVAAAPLRSKGRVHGALVVHYWSERTFSEEDTTPLQLLAEQAALAIDNARVYAEATNRAERLRTLVAVAQGIIASLDVRDVMQRIARAAGDITPGAMASVDMLDEDGTMLRVAATSSAEAFEGIPPVRPATAGLRGLVVERRAPVLVADPLTDPRTLVYDWWAKRPQASFYGVPITVGDTFVGVLAYVLPEGLPDPEDQEVLRLLAAQAGVAIRNARLFREAQHRRDVAETLARVGRDLTTTLDDRGIAELVTRGIVDLFGVRTSAVFIHDPARGSLQMLAALGPDAEAMRDLTLEPGESVAGRAVLERTVVATPDILGEARRFGLSAALRERVRGHDNRAVAAAPLLTGERIIGAITLGDRVGREFGAEELEALQAFADRAALALENARLYREAQESLTRLHDTQAQLVQAAKMSALGQLVSGVAHELNNPLSVIIGYGQLLLARDIPPPLKRPVELMVSQGDRMAKIVRNLLYFARQRPPERGAVDLNQVVEQTLALRQNQLTLSGIVVEKDLAPRLPSITGDTQQLEQVFLNLLLNAEQAILEARPGGRIRLRTRLGAAGATVVADVADDGPGVPPEALPRVFEPFFTTKMVGSGTGLGLSVSYGIVQEHGGRLSVQSRPGETVFTLELPVTPPPDATAEAPPRRPAARGEGRVALVVEDEPAVLELVVTLLKEGGWRVDVAPGGRLGLEAVRRARYDLIVSDMRMPEGAGEDFYRAVLAHDPDLGRRFVFITGDTANLDARRFLDDAKVPVIEKPFPPVVFEEAVHRVLAGV